MQMPMSTIDLRQIEIFYHVAKHLSFSKAADVLLLTQPTISGHIKALEESLDLVLFDRLGREIRLTRAGDMLFGYAKRLLATKTSALQALQTLHGGLQGELVIGGSSIPGQYVLPRILGEFQSQCPEITVILSITDTMETLDRIVRGEFELGIVGATVSQSNLVYDSFLEDELVVAAPAPHAWASRASVSLAELAQEVFIQRERGSGSRLAVEKTLAEHGLEPTAIQVVAEMSTTEAIKQGIKAGLGVSIISRLALEDEVRAGSICMVEIDGVRIQRHFSIVRHAGRTLSPLARTFERFLQGLMPLSVMSNGSMRNGQIG